jgi:hypothetical protein
VRIHKPGNVIVRCGAGHLYSTIWLPLGSLKAVRLGPRRFQRCPVGHHWSWVRRIDPSTLTDDERRTAEATKDLRTP